MAGTGFKSVDEYIASKPKEVRTVLERVRDAIRKAVPKAEEMLSYQMPMYKLNGRLVLYFAGWKEHYSLYPASDTVAAAFKKELSGYELRKSTIRLPLSEPVPVKLIERIAKFRAQQLAMNEKRTGASKKGRETPLERVRRICSTMPSVSEKLSHGAPAFFVQKDKGVFTIFTENHHEDGRIAIWLPAPPALQPALIEDAPDTYFKPPYVGASGWVGIMLDKIRDDALEIHIREAWEISARKSKGKRFRQGV
ncbi:MAG TPA: DUF1801 domain-containing protein [Terriglobia bacterium]|jgi:uncharacterized protein YdhG (YjbR/CyaY superfamily)